MQSFAVVLYWVDLICFRVFLLLLCVLCAVSHRLPFYCCTQTEFYVYFLFGCCEDNWKHFRLSGDMIAFIQLWILFLFFCSIFSFFPFFVSSLYEFYSYRHCLLTKACVFGNAQSQHNSEIYLWLLLCCRVEFAKNWKLSDLHLCKWMEKLFLAKN